MNKKPLVIIGAGEFAMIAYEYFTHDSDYEVIGFCVEQAYLKETELYGLPILALETITDHYSPENVELFIAIPASQLNRLRTRLYTQMKQLGYQFATYISSQAFVWRNAKIGENTFIFEHNTIQPFVQVGNNVILWSGNHVGHRSVIGDHCFVSSHVVISGYCNIGKSCFLGVNSTINDNMKIADSIILASASLVNKPLLEEESIYVGSPAKKIPNKSSLDVKL